MRSVQHTLLLPMVSKHTRAHEGSRQRMLVHPHQRPLVHALVCLHVHHAVGAAKSHVDAFVGCVEDGAAWGCYGGAVAGGVVLEQLPRVQRQS